ncbi:hypothetical protein QJS10_CPA07g01368 [Acorus calamus]|uniref:Cytochrome P450 n=1 Tax=Acorus calamus TaxID=4465 RepID=A0AAV9EFN8_ACOCL|nr:hypothetical protein QJS10_CPA07g01368 [Acorus calamus]
MILSLIAVLFGGFVLHLYNVYWLRPERLRRRLRTQGIVGPPPSFPFGNVAEMKRIELDERRARMDWGTTMHNYDSAVIPCFDLWRKEYGPLYMYTTGNTVTLYVARPDLVKEINLCTSLDLGKPMYLRKVHEPLFGNGILKSNGPIWAHQRKIISPQFYMDKVKAMVDLMVDSTEQMLRSWEDSLNSNGGGVTEIRVDDDLRILSSNVISRACFGSNHTKGNAIFLKLRSLQASMAKHNHLSLSPLWRSDQGHWKVSREIQSSILKLVQEHRESSAAMEKNLLQAMLESADGDLDPDVAEHFIVDNFKSIYFAGHETTAVVASWCLMLLALHPDWQTRARAEVVEICGGRPPNADSLNKLKTLTMIIQETLRLYPPGVSVAREALQDTKLGDIYLPKGANLFIPISTLHHDILIWGTDADSFNPLRFARGVSGACDVPHAYVPFGVGARSCLGQYFAMTEMKVVLSLLLAAFEFELSPSYRHSPVLRMIVQPEFGVSLLVKRCVHCDD